MSQENERVIDELLPRLDRCDLSALLALRVLSSEVNGDGWVSLGALTHELEREFARLGAAPESSVTASARPWESTPAPDDEEREYCRQHVVRLLLEHGLVAEKQEGTDEAPHGDWVRLAPALREQSDSLSQGVEARLATVRSRSG